MALSYLALLQVQVIHNLRDSSRCKPGDGYCNLSVHYHMLVQVCVAGRRGRVFWGKGWRGASCLWTTSMLVVKQPLLS